MNIDKPLVQLEERTTAKAVDNLTWVIEVVEKNDHGEIVVVGRHYHFKKDKQDGLKNAPLRQMFIKFPRGNLRVNKYLAVD
jgi:hypothetical protein